MILFLGWEYRTTPLEWREQVAIPSQRLSHAFRVLRSSSAISEAVLLSTCNRVECYVATDDPERASHDVANLFLSSRNHAAPELFRYAPSQLTDAAAVQHLFRVSAGLESMVLGESEIVAQVKHAYEMARAEGMTGSVLNPLFQKALHAAKIVRSQTAIAAGQTSIGAVVVSLVRQLFAERMRSCEMLLWGAGKAAETTARHLIKTGIGHLWVVNRTQPKAQDLASLCQSGWLSWEQAMHRLASVDVAIVCTQAPHYVIDASDIDRILPQRQQRPLCLIDLAVPRNVDPALKTSCGVRLYNIDDLQTMTQTGISQRLQELSRCNAIIQRQVDYFWQSWNRDPDKNKEESPCAAVGVYASV